LKLHLVSDVDAVRGKDLIVVKLDVTGEKRGKASLQLRLPQHESSSFARSRHQRARDASRLVGKVPGLENNVPQGGVVWLCAVKK
jgi:hypothetical protein